VGSRLEQSRLFLRIEAEILPQGVRYRERDLLRSYETVVSFLEIDPSLTTYFDVNRWYLAICVGLVSFVALRAHSYLFDGAATLGQVLWAWGWAVVACAGTWMRAARYVGFRAAGIGLFFFERGGRDDPRPFLRSITAARDVHLERLRRSDSGTDQDSDDNHRQRFDCDGDSIH
jgi:hypothetical protein